MVILWLIIQLCVCYTNINDNYCRHYVSFDFGLLLSTWVVALHAEFDQYLDEPVILMLVGLLQNWITNYHTVAGNTACSIYIHLLLDHILTQPVQVR